MTADARRRSQKRSTIIDAAISVFAEKGFRQARVSDVARRAGVADGTIYLYFKNKEDLLLSIFEEKMDVLLQGLREDLEGVTDPLEQIRTFARYHFRQVKEEREIAEVLQVELRLSYKFFHDYRPEKLWEYLRVFEDIVRDAQASGLARADVDPFLSSWAFFGSLDELSMQWVLHRRAGRERFDLDRAADQVAGMFIQGMVRPSHVKEAT